MRPLPTIRRGKGTRLMAARSRRSTSKKTPAAPKPGVKDASSAARTPNAKNSTQIEFPDDPNWNAMVALFRETGVNASARMGKLRESVGAVATIYEEHETEWSRYLSERAVKRGKRGPAATSKFHALCKHLLAIDGSGDQS